MSHEIMCLDHGFVRLVSHMGDDGAIVRAARVAYGEGSKGEEADKKLIKYLLDNAHTSPFEHVQFTFHVKCPIFVARQWMRHRTWSYNEISGRYTTDIGEEYYLPTEERLRAQGMTNKQGSGERLLNANQLRNEMHYALQGAGDDYQYLLRQGLSRELARLVLPVGYYTQFYATVDLHNLLHFIRLRTDSHAQWEIQQYAQALESLVQPIVPWTMEAWHGNDDSGEGTHNTEDQGC